MGVSVNVEDQGSLDEAFRRHERSVLRLCRVLLGNVQEAEDVTQEVLLKLFRQQTSQPDTDWGPWLRRVAINACRDRRRSAWSRLWRRDGKVPLEDVQIAGREPSPEQQLAGAEVRREIWTAFRRLSARQREVFALRHVQELTTAEVAETLGITEGSAKRHLFRAVRSLRTALGGVR